MSVHRRYADEFKFELAKRYVEAEGSYSSLAKQHGISHVLLLTWVKKYRRGGFANIAKLQQYEQQIRELQAVVNKLAREQVAASLP